MSVEEKVAKGIEEKELGNASFKAGDLNAAFRHYHTVSLS
jgi:hypothetical protein